MCQQRLLKKILTQNKFTSTLGDKKTPKNKKNQLLKYVETLMMRKEFPKHHSK